MIDREGQCLFPYLADAVQVPVPVWRLGEIPKGNFYLDRPGDIRRIRNIAATGKGKLEVGGTGTAKEFDALIDKLNGRYGFDLK